MKTKILNVAVASLFLCLPVVGAIGGTLATTETAPEVQLTVKDLTPKFLLFYDDAMRQQTDADQRWLLWKKDYNFAAVPPTPAGQVMARHLLDAAWPRYPSVLERIRAGAAGMDPDPQTSLRAVAALLKPERPVKLTLAVYVGGFEENAFTSAVGGNILVAVPIEVTPQRRELSMVHEMTHGVQISMGSFSGGWIRTVGTTVLTEGLATRVTQHLVPGLPETAYVEGRAGWLAEANGKRTAILTDVLGALNSNSSADVMRYTFEVGPGGIEREAYYAGWVVVGYWLAHGMSYTDIARIPEDQMPARVGAAIETLLGASGNPGAVH